MVEIHTPRLRLLALNQKQLEQYLYSPHELEVELGFELAPIDPAGPVQRAINIKISKMAQAAKDDHLWYTYWLIVPHQAPYGAGMIGFKGIPNLLGEAEIGYGIEPAFQSKGYMTEAARLLVEVRAAGSKPSRRVFHSAGVRREATTPPFQTSASLSWLSAGSAAAQLLKAARILS